MLSRIFGFKQKKHNKPVRLSDSNDDTWLEDFHITERGLPTLEKSQIRVLVFKDHDKKGDKCVLFDSKTASRDEPEQQDAGNKRPIRRRSSADVPLLGEMIFGSVEMTYKGPTVKAHSIRTPPQLLLTKVFALKAPRASHGSHSTPSMSEYLQTSNKFSESTSSVSSQQSRSTFSIGLTDSEEQQIARSVPVLPADFTSPAHSYQLQNFVEGFSNSMSGSNNSLNATLPMTSSGSYQRRWLRSQVTRIDYGCQRRNEVFNEEMSMRLRRRPKIGIGILFSLWEGKEISEENNRLFQSFCFSHFPIIESHVHRLKRKIEKAMLASLQISGKLFQDAVLNASRSFADGILQLYYAPRIRSPIWLTMLSQPDQCDQICEDLVPQLVNVVEMYNRKDTNFFMSSLLTAVLTYHVAWVTTVTPSNVLARRAYLDKHSSEVLNVLGVSHPYNPLWAQLSDLYGAGGDPTKTARTVILGEDRNLVTMLLHILSYFIRCSEVYEQTMEHAPAFTTADPICAENVDHVDSETSQENPEQILECISEKSSEVFENFVKVSHKDIAANISENSSKVSGNLLGVSEKHSAPNISENSSKVFENFIEISHKDVEENPQQEDVANILTTTRDQCNDVVVDEKDYRTFESCTCSSVFAGNSKENKLWKSFLRTSCRNRTCRKISEESKGCYPCSKSVTLDDSWLTKNRVSSSMPRNPRTLSRRHSSENKSEPLNCHNSTFCIQNDGKTFSLDRQSILNMFQTSFPLCPICKGKLSFVENDFYDQSALGSGLCSECDKRKSCSCEMIDSEFSGSCNTFGSSITVNSEGYCSGFSVVSSDTEIQDCLDTLSIDSGVNDQCVKSTENVNNLQCFRSRDNVDSAQCKKSHGHIGQDKGSTDGNQLHVLQIPEFETVEDNQGEQSTNHLDCQLFSFGRSLMAGYCDRYLPDFVLHGTAGCTEEQTKYDLKISLEQPVVDSPVLEAVVILGNTDTWECKVSSLRKPKKGFGNCVVGKTSEKNAHSNLVHDFLTSFCDLWEMNMSAQFCLMHLEDKMKEIYLRSKVISEYLLTQKKYITMNDLMSTFGYSECDLALLMSVIGVHSPTAVSRIPLL